MKRLPLAAGILVAGVAVAVLTLSLGTPSVSTPTAESPTSEVDYTAQLEALVGRQTTDQISAIVSPGRDVQVLVDSNTGRYLAALRPVGSIFRLDD